MCNPDWKTAGARYDDRMSTTHPQVVTVTVGPFESNCHILVPAPGRRALVIDPGDDADVIVEQVRRVATGVAGYLVTHGHVDHVSALAEVCGILPAPVAMHPDDAAWAFTERNAMPPYYPTPRRPAAIDREVCDGQTLDFEGCSCAILWTPGHSPGSVCFHFPGERLLFTGDVLFRGAIGRSDLPGGDSRTLSASLDRLLTLPAETTVYSGHGPATTLGRESRSNPFLRDRSWV